MFHRYGRHGPGAWKRLQKRKYVNRSTVAPIPVAPPTTMMVRVVVPASIERMIVILMPENPPQPNENQSPGQSVQVFAGQGLQLQDTDVVPSQQENGDHRETTPGDPQLINHAQWKALSDVKAVKRLVDSGNFVRIDRPKLAIRIETFVDHYLENRIAHGEPAPGLQDYQRLIQQFRDAYLPVFNEGVSQIAHGTINSPIEARLRELAIADRRAYPAPWRRPFHQRDLAVLQVLLELDISLDRAKEELETIHVHADSYERYYANPREEVTWPKEDSSF